jgi:hypothetical protein
VSAARSALASWKKKEETNAAALAVAELGITVEELAELEGRTAPEPELSPTED